VSAEQASVEAKPSSMPPASSRYFGCGMSRCVAYAPARLTPRKREPETQ